MKRSILCLLFCSRLLGQTYVNIPDPVFAAHLSTLIPAAISGSSLNISHTLVTQNTGTLFFNNLAINDFEGLQYFGSLKGVSFTTCNSITNIPSIQSSVQSLSFFDSKCPSTLQVPPTLVEFKIEWCSLVALPVLNKELRLLACNYSTVGITSFPDSLRTLLLLKCGIQSLPNLPSKLEKFWCTDNPIAILPTLPPGLQILNCSYNYNLTSLPILPLNLSSLNCQYSPVGNLASLPGTLRSFWCDYTQIDTIVLPPQLEILSCSENSLRTLPPLPSKITYLNCAKNLLKVLPTLPALKYLNCQSNRLKVLPAIPSSLRELVCSNNQLTYLPELPDSLFTLYCGSNQITCLRPYPPHIQHPFLKQGPYYLDVFPNPLLCIPEISQKMNPYAPQNLYSLCTSQQNLECSKITGNMSRAEIHTFRLFPNPVSDFLFVESSETMVEAIRMYDSSGKEIFYKTEVGNSISVQSLPAGLYILTGYWGQNSFMQRFVIAR